jgi:hypothetical protein
MREKMAFMKRSSEYVVEYKTREDAKKAILKDSRVKDVKIVDIFNCNGRLTGYQMVVITNGLMPARVKPGLEPLIKGPTGEYEIYIRQPFSSDGTMLRNHLDVRISRRYCMVQDRIQTHITHDDDWNQMCWGSAAEDVGQIRDKLDWYWLSEYALNLIEDFDDGSLGIVSVAMNLFFFQLNYNPKLKNKLVSALKKIYADTKSSFYKEYSGNLGTNDSDYRIDKKYDRYEYFKQYGIGTPKPDGYVTEAEKKRRALEAEKVKNIPATKSDDPIMVGDRIVMIQGSPYGLTVQGCEGVVQNIDGARINVIFDKGTTGHYPVDVKWANKINK